MPIIDPVYQEIHFRDPIEYASLFADNLNTVFLDSALQEHPNSKYSYIAIDPVSIIRCKNDMLFIDDHIIKESPFDYLQQVLENYKINHNPDLPPFQTGLAGYFGYELYQHLEEIPITTADDFKFPDMVLGIYDVTITFDLENKRAWIISSGYPEEQLGLREERALKRIKIVAEKLSSLTAFQTIDQTKNSKIGIESNFSKIKYLHAVNTAIEYIYAGDIFQTNLSQRFSSTLDTQSPFNLYLRLRSINPAPFSAYMNFGNTIIASGSPERFIKLDGRDVETRPIKGTRPRGKTAEEDLQFATELTESTKDRSENIMIVDLMRNDLSKVCMPHSVITPDICKLESFATVHHLVSTVIGKLEEKYNAIDLLKATFPGGSITGAPKIRAMKIISELEKTSRGPYCGNAGFISFTGDMDTSILIRTFAIKENKISFHAGGGIVSDSVAESEYDETLDKAKALFDALGIKFL